MSASATNDLRNLLNGYKNTALLYVAARLGIATALAEGARHVSDLADVMGADAAALHRILRGLCVVGICEEVSVGRFGLTTLGETFRPGGPGGLHALAIITGEEYIAAWTGLLHSARTGETAFDHVFGMSPWQHRKENPELNSCFNTWLEASTGGASDSILAAFDFSRFNTIADVGGGHGALITRILETHPGVKGVLFDREHVLNFAAPHLSKAGVAERCELVAGDFFSSVSVNADAIIMKSILHDWDDEKSRTILRNCRKSLGSAHRLLLIERILPTHAIEDVTATMMDLHMLAVTSGRERSEAEYRALLEAANFSLIGTHAASSGFSIMEASPVGS